MKTKFLCAALVFAAIPLAAQAPAPPAPSAREAKIRELLRVTGSGRLAVQMVDQMLSGFRKAMPDVPAAFWDELRSEIKPEDFETLIIPIYEKHYDDADLQGLLDFYDSPLGRKMLREMPDILTESMETGRRWGQGLAEKVIERLRKKGYETGASPADPRSAPDAGAPASVRRSSMIRQRS